MKVQLLAVLLCLHAGLPARDLPGPPSAQERLQAARDAIQGKDWRKALAELDEALREKPRNADIHNLLGYSYRKQARPDLPRAFEHYRMALSLNPAHRGAHEYIGEAYLMDRKPREAEKHLAALEKICGNKQGATARVTAALCAAPSGRPRITSRRPRRPARRPDAPHTPR